MSTAGLGPAVACPPVPRRPSVPELLPYAHHGLQFWNFGWTAGTGNGLQQTSVPVAPALCLLSALCPPGSSGTMTHSPLWPMMSACCSRPHQSCILPAQPVGWGPARSGWRWAARAQRGGRRVSPQTHWSAKAAAPVFRGARYSPAFSRCLLSV